MNFKKMISLLKKCYPIIKPFMGQNMAFIVATECGVALSLLVPLGLRFLIDTIVAESRWDIFPVFVICMVAVVVLSRLLSIATNILYGRFSANIEAKARDSLFSYIIKKDILFFTNTGDGEIVDRLMRSPEQLHTIPSIYLERLISSVSTFLIVSIILLSIYPPMAIFSFIATPIFIVIYLKTRSLFFGQVQRARDEAGKLADFYTSTIHNIKQVKNFGSEHDEQKLSEGRNDTIKLLSLKFSITGAFVTNSIQIITQFNQLGVLIYGAVLIHKGYMTVGSLVAFYSYLELLYQPIISIIQTLNDMNGSLVEIERYLKYYTHEHEEEYENGGATELSSSSIDFCNVSFSYGDHSILSDISFHIDDSEKVLLCGKSGIGKSTIAALIKRFYPCTEGYIEIGGRNINQYDLRTLRINVAYMAQENYFFPTSIRENFTRIDPDISDMEIESILHMVSLYDDIYTPEKEGLDTSLKKNAVTFSGGQRRRLSLAMILASPAPIVILDEPFYGVDKVTQGKIWRNIKDRLRNKTVIIIDHDFPDKEYFQKTLELNSCSDIV